MATWEPLVRWADVPEHERATPDQILRMGYVYPSEIIALLADPKCPFAVRPMGRDTGIRIPCPQRLACGQEMCSLHCSRVRARERAPDHVPGTPWPSFEQPYAGLSHRVVQTLKRSNVRSLGQAQRMSDDELLSLRNLGHSALTEIRAAPFVETTGLRAPEPPPALQITFRRCEHCRGTGWIMQAGDEQEILTEGAKIAIG